MNIFQGPTKEGPLPYIDMIVFLQILQKAVTLRATVQGSVSLRPAPCRTPLPEWCWKCQSFCHVWLFVAPWTAARKAPSVHDIFQTRVLEWVAIPFSRGPSQPRYQTWVYGTAGKPLSASCLYAVACLSHQGIPAWRWGCLDACSQCGSGKLNGGRTALQHLRLHTELGSCKARGHPTHHVLLFPSGFTPAGLRSYPNRNT